MNKSYEQRKAAGACMHCGKTDERTRAGKVLCLKCKDKQTIRERARRDALVSMGKCPVCGEKKEQSPFILCAACRAREKHRREVKQMCAKYHSYRDAYAMCPYYMGSTTLEIVCSGVDGSVTDVLRFKRGEDTDSFRARYCDSIKGCQQCLRHKMRSGESE